MAFLATGVRDAGMSDSLGLRNLCILVAAINGSRQASESHVVGYEYETEDGLLSIRGL